MAHFKNVSADFCLKGFIFYQTTHLHFWSNNVAKSFNRKRITDTVEAVCTSQFCLKKTFSRPPENTSWFDLCHITWYRLIIWFQTRPSIDPARNVFHNGIRKGINHMGFRVVIQEKKLSLFDKFRPHRVRLWILRERLTEKQANLIGDLGF